MRSQNHVFPFTMKLCLWQWLVALTLAVVLPATSTAEAAAPGTSAGDTSSPVTEPAPPEPALEPGEPEQEHYHQTGQFPEEARDSDGDGVPDIDDNCPETLLDASGKQKVDECGCLVAAVDPCSLDSDQDGVDDCKDKCPNTYAGHRIGADGCPLPLSEPVRLRVDVKFAFDKASIQPGYEADLMRLRESLIQYPEINISLEGHTDWTGTVRYNQRLSERRAQACRDFILKDSGIDPARVTAIGYGKSKPIATNRTFEGRQQNRRTVVEFSFDRTILPVNDQPPPMGGLAPETKLTPPPPAKPQ